MVGLRLAVSVWESVLIIDSKMRSQRSVHAALYAKRYTLLAVHQGDSTAEGIAILFRD